MKGRGWRPRRSPPLARARILAPERATAMNMIPLAPIRRRRSSPGRHRTPVARSITHMRRTDGVGCHLARPIQHVPGLCVSHGKRFHLALRGSLPHPCR